jgi:hypothetical protein
MGFNDSAAEHLASISAWSPGCAAPIFRDSSRIGDNSVEYRDLAEKLLDLSTEVCTRTEVYILKALAEGYVLGDFQHTFHQLSICYNLQTAQVNKPALVCPDNGHWWPSIAEHFYAVDYYTKVETFTQLTELFALAHAQPEAASEKFRRLKADPALYDTKSLRWLKAKFAYDEGIERSPVFTSRDQLMSVCVESLLDPREAALTLARYKASNLYAEGRPLPEEDSDGVDNETDSPLDKLLLVAAEVFVKPAEARSAMIVQWKADPSSPFNQTTGAWFTQARCLADQHPSEDMMQRLLSIILNRIGDTNIVVR